MRVSPSLLSAYARGATIAVRVDGGRELRAEPGVRVRGRVTLGEKVGLMRDCELLAVAPDAQITLGDHVFVNRGARIVASRSISIGAETLIGDEVRVLDSDYHRLAEDADPTAPVVIGPRVWVASGAMVLRGVTIGEGAVIGARALVTHDVPAHTLAVGSPARVVREGVRWYR